MKIIKPIVKNIFSCSICQKHIEDEKGLYEISHFPIVCDKQNCKFMALKKFYSEFDNCDLRLFSEIYLKEIPKKRNFAIFELSTQTLIKFGELFKYKKT